MTVPVLFDNSVFRTLCQQRSRANYRYAANLLGTLGGDWTVALTPYFLLEVLGITIKTKPLDFTVYPRCASCTEEITRVFSHVRNHFSSFPYLKASVMKERWKKQLRYFDSHTIGLEPLYSAIKRRLDSSVFTEQLHAMLAFDHIFQKDSWNSGTVDIHKRLFLEGLNAFTSGFSVPLFRLAYRMYLQTTAIALKKAKQESRNRSLPIRPFTIKSKKDYLDLDLIQYAILGSPTVRGYAPIVVTHDCAVEVRHRLEWFKVVMKHFSETIDPAKAGFTLPTPVFGTVLIVDESTGRVKECIPTSTLKEGPYSRQTRYE